MNLHFFLLCICLTMIVEGKENKVKGKCKRREICNKLAQLQDDNKSMKQIIERQNGRLMSVNQTLQTIQEQIDNITKSDLEGKDLLECSDVKDVTKVNGTFTLYPYGPTKQPVTAYCEFDSEGNGWTVFQRRSDGSINFNRGWDGYKHGFGSKSMDIDGEFWLGNDVLHEMTSHGKHELLIVLSDFEGATRYAKYSTFSIGDVSSGFKLSVWGYSGTAGDSFSYHNGMQFYAFDKDILDCAARYGGGWWFNSCHYSNLNGEYLKGHHKFWGKGVSWNKWHGFTYSLKSTKMMIRKL